MWIIVCKCRLLMILFVIYPYLNASSSSVLNGRGFQLEKCVNHTTNEEGVCMFAMDCAKSKGKHVGVCIQRFYFGSCCVLNHKQTEPTLLHNFTDSATQVIGVGSQSRNMSLLPSSDGPISILLLLTSKENSTTVTSPQNADSDLDDHGAMLPSATVLGGLLTNATAVITSNLTITGTVMINETVIGENKVTHPNMTTNVSDCTTTTTSTTIISPTPPAIISPIPSTTPSLPTSTTVISPTPPTIISPTPPTIISPTPSATPSTSSTALSPILAATVSSVPSTNLPSLSTTTISYMPTTKTPSTLTTTIIPSISTLTISSTLSTLVTSSTTKLTTVMSPTNQTTNLRTPIIVTTILPSTTLIHTYKKACGKPKYRNPKIVNGEDALPYQWPWQISLQLKTRFGYDHKCGAVLINEEWALTAAHCVYKYTSDSLLLKMGGINFTNPDEFFVERKVEALQHPKFNWRTFHADIALLKMNKPVKYQASILPICLPETGMNFDNDYCVLTGWGRLQENGRLPTLLQQVSVPVVNSSYCEEMYRMSGFKQIIDPTFICAGYAIGQKDACEGDSGGPMVVWKNGRWVLAGIISFGSGCARKNQPGVGTRVTEYLDWIYSVIYS